MAKSLCLVISSRTRSTSAYMGALIATTPHRSSAAPEGADEEASAEASLTDRFFTRCHGRLREDGGSPSMRTFSQFDNVVFVLLFVFACRDLLNTDPMCSCVCLPVEISSTLTRCVRVVLSFFLPVEIASRECKSTRHFFSQAPTCHPYRKSLTS